MYFTGLPTEIQIQPYKVNTTFKLFKIVKLTFAPFSPGHEMPTKIYKIYC